MSANISKPQPESVIYEDNRLYVFLAKYPITAGHVIVLWKEDVADLHLLSRPDYEHLMDVVDDARNAMMTTLGVKKVYLLYMDELNHVHWHLVPRYNEQGFDVFKHEPVETKDFSLAAKIKANISRIGNI